MIPGERVASMALAGMTLAPLIVDINPNLNVILTACLAVYVGCYRTIKPKSSPVATMSKGSSISFPFVASAALFSLFLMFKFLPADWVNVPITAYFFVTGNLALTATVLSYLPKSWNHKLIDRRHRVTVSQCIAAISATIFCVWYAKQKHWLANNVLGLAFCLQGIETLSLGSFTIGGIVLGGLFVYDAFWVFCTPVMGSVAESFDAPVKLLFPTGNSARSFGMLGLGDIVIPGIFVALALRFDVSRGKGNRYFKSAFFGYAVGLALTVAVMNWFQAAQPALLYIVPAVIGSVAVHCKLNGDVKPLLEYNESKKVCPSSSQDGQPTGEEKTSKKEE